MVKNPEELLYTKSHEWVKFIDDNTAAVGLTEHAQHELGDLVFVGLPEPGDSFSAGEAFADVESVKAVSDVYTPISGKVAKVNEKLTDAPQLINQDPYGSWIAEFRDITEKGQLMAIAEYEAYLGGGA